MRLHGRIVVSEPTTPTLPARPVRTPSRRRRALLIAAIGAAALVLLALFAVVYAGWRLGQIRRVAVSGIVPAGSGQPQNILVAGSDSRAGESAAAAQHFGSAAQVTGQRSDVIILIHLDPRTSKASMLSIPRDLFVPIPGSGSSNRINFAFNQGPAQLVRTISQDLGITINHYAQEDFGGLQSLDAAAGGVCMNFPYPARDGSPTGQGDESGLDIPTPGRHVLGGTQALALVRSRYYQYEVNGVWRAEGTGDIGRIQRQHTFMRALAAKALHASLRNPFTADRVLGRAVHDVTVDSSFTRVGLLRLGLHFRSMKPTGIPSWTLPYRAVNGFGGFGDVLMPVPDQDAAVIAAWQGYGAPGKGAAAPSVDPASVSVRVENGSGVAGQAQRAATALRAAGFGVTGYGTATAKIGADTVVRYPSGQAAKAKAVAALLGGPVRLTQDRSVSTIVVTTGTGFTGVAAPAAPTSSSTPPPASSTVPPWDPTPC